jgi:hypothetical protein
MGAFVERARLIRDAAGNNTPEAGEGLEVQIVLQPPRGHVQPDLASGQRPNAGQIVGDHRHLAVREARYGDSIGRRPAARGDPMRFAWRRQKQDNDRGQCGEEADHDCVLIGDQLGVIRRRWLRGAIGAIGAINDDSVFSVMSASEYSS